MTIETKQVFAQRTIGEETFSFCSEKCVQQFDREHAGSATTGVSASGNLQYIELPVVAINGQHGASRLEEHLKTLPGVRQVTANAKAKLVRIRCLLHSRTCRGTVPYLALRIAVGALWAAGKITPGVSWGTEMSQQQFAQLAQVSAGVQYLQQLYYDTTFSYPSTVFPSLQAFAEPSHLLFGSDYSWAGEAIASLLLTGMESYQGLDEQAGAAFERDNALYLFPCLDFEAKQ